MIKPIIRFIQALQSNTSPSEIAAGAVMSLYIGLTPWKSTHLIFLILIFLFFKINRAATMILLPFIKLIDVLVLRYAVDAAGFYLLTKVAFLKPVFTFCADAPVFALMNLNHTRVLGGLVFSLVLSPFVFIGMIKFVGAYRAGLKSRIDNMGIVKWVKGLMIVKWIARWWPK